MHRTVKQHWVLVALLAALAGCEAERASALTFDQESISESLPRGLQRVVTLRASLPVAAVKVGSGAPWLSAEVAADDDSQTLVRVTLDASELEEGDFTTTLSANEAGAAPMKIAVSLTVTPQESLLADLSVVALSIPQGASETANLVVRALTGVPEISLDVATAAPWLSIGTSGGTSPLAVTLVADTSGLAQGHYETELRLSATGYGPAAVSVALDVTKPALQFGSPGTTVYGEFAGSFELQLVASNGAAADFSLLETCGWMSVTPTSGTTPATITVSYDLPQTETLRSVQIEVQPSDAVTFAGSSHTIAPVTGVGPQYLLARIGTDSVVDVGLSGSGHGRTFPSNTGVLFQTSCASGPPYTDCRLRGPLSLDSVAGPGLESTRRCKDEEWMQCTDDRDCNSGRECKTYLGPPMPVGRDGTGGYCSLAWFDSDLDGTVNLDSGELSLSSVTAFTKIFISNDSAYNCPTCDAGVCSRGFRAGQPCTVGGVHAFTGEATSLDCPPGASVFRELLSLPLGSLSASRTSATAGITLTAENPFANGSSTERTPCGTCGQPDIPTCNVQADCSANHYCSLNLHRCLLLDLGDLCQSNEECLSGVCLGDYDSRDRCEGDTCDPVAGQSGQCSATVTSRSCSNANWMSCTLDSHCTLPGALGSGTCTESARHTPCFSDLSAGRIGDSLLVPRRVRSMSDMDLGWVVCTNGSGGVADNVGLPGPVRIQLKVSAETFNE